MEGTMGKKSMRAMEGSNKTGKSTKHAHEYPGREMPKMDKARDAKHDQAALECGRMSSMGVSADGSHKGLKK